MTTHPDSRGEVDPRDPNHWGCCALLVLAFALLIGLLVAAAFRVLE